MRATRRQADAFPRNAATDVPTSQILGEVGRHQIRCDCSVQIVSQPQLTSPILDPRSRILRTDSLEKCFDGRLAAISGRNCGWHAARPRPRWNYGSPTHCHCSPSPICRTRRPPAPMADDASNAMAVGSSRRIGYVRVERKGAKSTAGARREASAADGRPADASCCGGEWPSVGGDCRGEPDRRQTEKLTTNLRVGRSNRSGRAIYVQNHEHCRSRSVCRQWPPGGCPCCR